MQYLVEDKEKEVVFGLSRKPDLCPVLNKVGSGDQRQKDPDRGFAEIRPRKQEKAAINDQSVEKNPIDMLELQGVKFIKLKREIPDEVGQD